ncbi:MAG: phospholipid carrier-dependent glycosyltransferase, partial [Chloroflexi bacterium]|nr:phospholipid carrier-dependent glycosyltransferase [Chloroflexota bacterium]
MATVGLGFVLWRRVLRDRMTAALASMLMAISYWHVHFSRYGIRAILMPLILTLSVYCLWRATVPDDEREWVIARAAKNWRATAQPSLLWAVLCGVCVGVSLYAHPAARFIPLIVVVWFAWRWWQSRAASTLKGFAKVRGQAQGLRLMLITLVAFVIFIPLGIYFVQNPQSFFGHPTVVAITDQRVSDGNLFNAFAANVARVLGMFFVGGDVAWIHNLSGRPVFDWLIALGFVVGLVVWAQKLRARESAVVLLLIWIAIMLLPTLLSDGAPNFSRAIGIMPALFVIPAWGMGRALDVVTQHATRNTQYAIRNTNLLRAASYVSIVSISALFTYNDYFNQFPRQ